MPLLSKLKNRIEQSELHFLNGLQMLKTISSNTSNIEFKSQLQDVITELERSEAPYDGVMQYLRMFNKKSVNNAPYFLATNVVELDKDDRGLERSIVRMNTSRIDQARQDKDAFFRRQAVKILNPVNGQFIIRMPMGGILKGLTRDSIALDYDAMDALGIRGKFVEGHIPTELVVSRAGPISIYFYYWNHPDVGYRLAMRLSFVGLLLGLIGFLPMVAGL